MFLDVLHQPFSTDKISVVLDVGRKDDLASGGSGLDAYRDGGADSRVPIWLLMDQS
jgi:hypothetical protein